MGEGQKIEETKEAIEHLHTDIAVRQAHGGQEFVMTVGNRIFSGKGAREEAAKALGEQYCQAATITRHGCGQLSKDSKF